MTSAGHRVVIEFDPSEGPPQGRIGIPGAREQAFHGWMDLTARLESLRRSSAPAEAMRRVDGPNGESPGYLRSPREAG